MTTGNYWLDEIEIETEKADERCEWEYKSSVVQCSSCGVEALGMQGYEFRCKHCEQRQDRIVEALKIIIDKIKEQGAE